MYDEMKTTWESTPQGSERYAKSFALYSVGEWPPFRPAAGYDPAPFTAIGAGRRREPNAALYGGLSWTVPSGR